MKEIITTVKSSITEALKTTAPDPNAFGTVAHEAAIAVEKEKEMEHRTQEMKHSTQSKRGTRRAAAIIALNRHSSHSAGITQNRDREQKSENAK